MGSLTVVPIFSPPCLNPCTQSQEKEHWWAIFALHAFSDVHVGIDNLEILGVARLLSHGDKGVPLSLVTDGDLLATIRATLRPRRFETEKAPR